MFSPSFWVVLRVSLSFLRGVLHSLFALLWGAVFLSSFSWVVLLGFLLPSLGSVAVFSFSFWRCCLPSQPLGGAAFLLFSWAVLRCFSYFGWSCLVSSSSSFGWCCLVFPSPFFCVVLPSLPLFGWRFLPCLVGWCCLVSFFFGWCCCSVWCCVPSPPFWVGLRSPSLLLGGAAQRFILPLGVAVFPSPVWWCCLPSPPLGGCGVAFPYPFAWCCLPSLPLVEQFFFTIFGWVALIVFFTSRVVLPGFLLLLWVVLLFFPLLFAWCCLPSPPFGWLSLPP